MEKNYLKNILNFVVEYLSIDFSEHSSYMQSAIIKSKLFGGYHNNNLSVNIAGIKYNQLENIIQNTNSNNNKKQEFCEYDYE
jgi:hypothetical protein